MTEEEFAETQEEIARLDALLDTREELLDALRKTRDRLAELIKFYEDEEH